MEEAGGEKLGEEEGGVHGIDGLEVKTRYVSAG
jgi:hypothetical protein